MAKDKEGESSQVGERAYLQDLYDKAIGGDLDAGAELSCIAGCGHRGAAELTDKMDKVLLSKD